MAKFQKKTAAQHINAVLQAEQAAGMSKFNGKMLTALVMSNRDLEKRVKKLLGAVSRVEARSRALIKILNDKYPNSELFTEDQLEAETQKIEIDIFNADSYFDDQRRNLEEYQGAAEKGMTAIYSVHLFRDGAEVINQRVIRSKAILGSNEIHEEIDNQIVGMTPGEEKTLELSLLNEKYVAQVKLYGLRQKKQPAPEAKPEEAKTDGAQPTEGN